MGERCFFSRPRSGHYQFKSSINNQFLQVRRKEGLSCFAYDTGRRKAGRKARLVFCDLFLFRFRCCFFCFRFRRDGLARLLLGFMSFWAMFQGFLKFRLAFRLISVSFLRNYSMGFLFPPSSFHFCRVCLYGRDPCILLLRSVSVRIRKHTLIVPDKRKEMFQKGREALLDFFDGLSSSGQLPFLPIALSKVSVC